MATLSSDARAEAEQQFPGSGWYESLVTPCRHGFVAGAEWQASRDDAEVAAQLRAAQATIAAVRDVLPGGKIGSEYITVMVPRGVIESVQRADTSAHDAAILATKTKSEYPWAVENRVVKSPPIALFRDREDAEEYADQSIDLRVIEQTEAE